MEKDRKKLVVIGTGIAGTYCLEEILRLDPERYDITVFGKERYLSYNRVLLSYVLRGEKTEEDICEEIRDELEQDAVFIEKIEYSEVFYDQLPEKARLNLGIRPDQKNVVATLTFRSLESSLPKAMVNGWMQRLYPKLNQGDRGYM